MGNESRPEVFKGNEENPAPGSYNIKSKINEGKAYKITMDNKKYAHDFDANKKTPAVGEYNLNNSLLNNKKIGTTIKPKPKIDYDTKTPGPGAYKNLEKKSGAPTFS